jgi:cytochrome c oxidase assembly protein subunit 11
VPLYRAFCQLTGFDGTVRRAEAAPDTVLARRVKVRFDTNVRDLPWSFTAEAPSQSIRIGETGLTHFTVTNHAKTPITGRAAYNVVPEQAGAYFQKIECFCFSDQTIQPGQTVEFPVVYFIDPKYAEDFETRDSTEVTLSYTYYPSVNAAKAERRADASQAKSAQGLGGTARAGL